MILMIFCQVPCIPLWKLVCFASPFPPTRQSAWFPLKVGNRVRLQKPEQACCVLFSFAPTLQNPAQGTRPQHVWTRISAFTAKQGACRMKSENPGKCRLVRIPDVHVRLWNSHSRQEKFILEVTKEVVTLINKQICHWQHTIILFYLWICTHDVNQNSF